MENPFPRSLPGLDLEVNYAIRIGESKTGEMADIPRFLGAFSWKRHGDKRACYQDITL